MLYLLTGYIVEAGVAAREPLDLYSCNGVSMGSARADIYGNFGIGNTCIYVCKSMFALGIFSFAFLIE